MEELRHVIMPLVVELKGTVIIVVDRLMYVLGTSGGTSHWARS